jgi:hypothetical protein
MKNFTFLFVLMLTLFVVNNQSIIAQEKRLNSSPEAFRTFFSKFINAVESSDKTAVASMIIFPFKYGFDVGDEGKMSKAQFVKRFHEIFGRSPKKFITEKNPVFRKDSASYIVSTEDAAHLIFVRDKSGFKFSAFMVEP